MKLLKRLLAVGGASALLIGGGIATPVLAAQPFSAVIELECAVPGDTQTITVKSTPGVLIHIEVTIGGSTVNGGTQNGTGVADANGTFTDQWTVAPVAASTTATVRIWAFTSNGVANGSRTFTIQPAGQPCASPSTISFSGSLIDTTQVGGTVAKTCDAGVTGNAVFSATLHLNLSQSLATTVVLPAGLNLTLACNGSSAALPVLPVGSTITLHESTPPAGAAAAADTTITVGSEAAVTTINNTKAAVASASATPTPQTKVLAPTGGHAGTPVGLLLGLGLIGLLLAAAGARLVWRPRN